VLAGLELERKPERHAPQPPPGSREEAVMLARWLAAEEAIPSTSVEELARLTETNGGMHYLIDVRSEAEYEAGHVPGSLNVPGGQAVQRADDFIAVRNAPIVFISEKSARSVMAAYWYRQMGFANASFLEAGVGAWSGNDRALVGGVPRDEPLGFAAARAAARFIAVADFERARGDPSIVIIDVGASVDFESAHVPGARWISRGSIESLLPERFNDRGQPMVVCCPDGRQSVFAGQTLVGMGYTNVRILEGGVGAWLAAGGSAESGLSECLAPANDVVLSPSIRGTPEDMRRYLEWELSLNR
jgi:rhodanese-related sulfurtransferase